MDNIYVVKALENIESQLSNVHDGDILVITMPAYASGREIERFCQHLFPRVNEIRQHTGRKFGVFVFTQGVTMEVVRNDREYTRLKVELEELKQTVAKLINKGEAK